jgi:putative flippase GtrA
MVAQMVSSLFWSRLLRYAPYWFGMLATAILTAQAMHLRWVDPATDVGQLIAFVGAMLNAYGVHGVAAWSPPRETWTMQQKHDESMRRIARGEAPLHGFEYLLPGVTANPPPLPPPTPIPGGGERKDK